MLCPTFCSHTPPSNPSRSRPLPYLLKSVLFFLFKLVSDRQWCAYTLRCVVSRWSTVNPPGPRRSPKLTLSVPAAINFQELLIWGWDLTATSPPHYGLLWGLACARPVHAVSTALNSQVELLHCAWKTLLACSHPWPLALKIFLSLLLLQSLSLGGREAVLYRAAMCISSTLLRQSSSHSRWWLP